MKDNKLGFLGLAALVFGMMVGAGIFNIPQNMAMTAGPLGVALSWIITAFGMLLLVFTFKILSERRPDLNAGLYLYAREGYGEMAGSLSAWGYWLCTAFANVAYVVMLNDSLGTLFPSLLSHGFGFIIFGTVLIWLVFSVVKCGMRSAAALNTIVSAVKIGCIFFIIALLIINIKLDTFSAAFKEILYQPSGEVKDLPSQIRGTMMVTLWCFIGIEGAVMMSERARRGKDVGRAGVVGFFAAWILYVLVSLLCYGVMARMDMSDMANPSVAYVLKEVCGEWAYWMVIASVVISIAGGWIAWSLVTAEVPYTAAKRGLFPKLFANENSQGIPERGLLASSVVMQMFIFVVAASENAYLTALDITGMMILPSYLFAGMFLTKGAMRDKYTPGIIIGTACSVFCLWMIYAGGLRLFFETSIFYIPGLVMYIIMQRKRRQGLTFTHRERVGMYILMAIAIISVALLVRK